MKTKIFPPCREQPHRDVRQLQDRDSDPPTDQDTRTSGHERVRRLVVLDHTHLPLLPQTIHHGRVLLLGPLLIVPRPLVEAKVRPTSGQAGPSVPDRRGVGRRDALDLPEVRGGDDPRGDVRDSFGCGVVRREDPGAILAQDFFVCLLAEL